MTDLKTAASNTYMVFNSLNSLECVSILTAFEHQLAIYQIEIFQGKKEKEDTWCGDCK